MGYDMAAVGSGAYFRLNIWGMGEYRELTLGTSCAPTMAGS
jgi:hypothetical protein